MSNPYDILGISSNSTDDEIKKAYRKLVQKYHPDAHPNKEFATKKMQEINEAHEKIKEMRKSGNTSYSNSNSSRRNSNTNRSSSNSSSRQNSNTNRSSNNSSSKQSSNTNDFSSQIYQNIRDKINLNLLDDADDLLSNIPSSSRNAEWYYLKGKISYSKGWLNDAQAQFTKAYTMNPSNQEYREAYERFEEKATGGVKDNPIKSCCDKDLCSPYCLLYPFCCIFDCISDSLSNCNCDCYDVCCEGGFCCNCFKCYLCCSCFEHSSCYCCDCCC